MNYPAAQFWFNVVIFFFTAGVGFYTWINNRQRATQKDVDDLSRSLSALRAELDAMPTHNDLGKLYDRLNQVAEAVNRIAGSMDGVIRQQQLVLEHLMKEGKRP